MTTTDPADAALDWIRTAIREERPQVHPDEVALLALTLDAIADEYSVRTDECVVWIHSDAFDEDPETWRAHCRQYAELQRRLCRQANA